MADNDKIIIGVEIDAASLSGADKALEEFAKRQEGREKRAQTRRTRLWEEEEAVIRRITEQRERQEARSAERKRRLYAEEEFVIRAALDRQEKADYRRAHREERLHNESIRNAQRRARIERELARETEEAIYRRQLAEERANRAAQYGNEARMGIGRAHTLMDSNMGGRRGVGWNFLGGQSFRTFGFQLRAIPGGGIAETMGRLSPLADMMAELATGTSAAGASALGLTAALVAFGVVVGALITRTNEMTEAVRKGIQEVMKFARAAEEMTTQDLVDKAREKEFQIAREQERLDNLRVQRDAMRAQYQGAVGGDPFAVLGSLVPDSDLEQLRINVSALSAEYDAQNEYVKTLEAEQLQLNTALLHGTNVYAQAEKELERLINLQETTSAEREEQIRRNQAIMNWLSQQLISGALSEEAVAIAEDYYDALRKQNVEMQTLGPTIADMFAAMEALHEAGVKAGEAINQLRIGIGELAQRAWERAQELVKIQNESPLTTQTDMLFEEQTNLGEALERVREATEAYNEALADHQERLLEIDAEAQEKREEAYADAADDFAEAEKDAQKKREEQEKEHRDRIAEINRKADRDIANAIANRDALAAYLAEQQRQDDLADEAARHKDQLEQIEEAYDDQKKAIQKRLDEQLEDIEKAAAKARATEQKRFAEQARDLQAAIDKQRSMVQLAEARLDQIRSGFMNGRVIKEYDHQNKLYNIAVAAQDAMLFRTQYFWNAMVDTIKVPGALARSGGGGGGTVARMGAMIDRRIDQRIGMTLGGMQ